MADAPATNPFQDFLASIPPNLITGDPTQTTTSVQDIPDWLKPYAQGLLGKAQGLTNAPYPYPDQSVQGFSPYGQVGQDIAGRRALGDTQFLGQANPLALQTLGGAFLSPQTNPWLNQTFNQAAQGVSDQYRYATAPSTQAEFNRAGAFGGSAENQTRALQQYGLGQTLNNLATDIYGGNYQQERQRQMQEQVLLPDLMNLQYQGPQMLQQIGQQQQGLGQVQQDTRYQNQWNKANWPYQELQMMSSVLNPMLGSSGGSTTTTGPNPNYQSPFQSLLGLGLIGQYGNQAFGGGNNNSLLNGKLGGIFG